MPIDVDPENLDQTALRLSDITATLRNCGADNVVLLLDACRSQGRRSGQGFGNEEQPGMVTVYSCSPREASYEIEALHHGAFTYALLEGLRLQGAQNCATVERLDQYLRYQVPELNRRNGKPRQTPYTAVEPISKNHLILLPNQSTLLADVQALKVAAFEAESEANYLLAEQLWIRVLAVSPADQQAIKAIKRLARLPLPTLQPDYPPIQPDSGRGGMPPPVTQPPKPQTPSFEFEVVTIAGIEKTGLLGMGAAKVITRSHKASAESYREDLGNGVFLDLVKIPAGTFLMGSPDSEEGRSDNEGPQHPVTVPPFLIGKYPVTQAQWRSVAGLPKVNRDLNPDPSRFKGANRPVEQVSWEEAVEFCDRLSRKTGKQYRLPSEAEWEYACRAMPSPPAPLPTGKGSVYPPFHFGETLTTDLANYDGNYSYGAGPKGQYRKQTTDVGSFPPNAFGLYDMHGNVREWCADRWHDNYNGAPTDGSAWVTDGDSSRRLLRGGSWNDYPRNCRSANRLWYLADFRYYDIGFRLACSASWTP